MEILSKMAGERNGEEVEIRKVGEYRVCGLLRRRNCYMAEVVFVRTVTTWSVLPVSQQSLLLSFGRCLSPEGEVGLGNVFSETRFWSFATTFPHYCCFEFRLRVVGVLESAMTF